MLYSGKWTETEIYKRSDPHRNYDTDLVFSFPLRLCLMSPDHQKFPQIRVHTTYSCYPKHRLIRNDPSGPFKTEDPK